MDTRQRVRLCVYDQPIVVRCPAPEEMYSLARQVEEKMRQFAAQDDRISITDLAILAALSFAGESTEDRRQVSDLRRRVGILEQKLAACEEHHAGQPRH